MKTAVIYARYSSDSQTEQSIEGQLRVCKDYAARNDITILDTYILIGLWQEQMIIDQIFSEWLKIAIKDCGIM